MCFLSFATFHGSAPGSRFAKIVLFVYVLEIPYLEHMVYVAVATRMRIYAGGHEQMQNPNQYQFRVSQLNGNWDFNGLRAPAGAFGNMDPLFQQNNFIFGGGCMRPMTPTIRSFPNSIVDCRNTIEDCNLADLENDIIPVGVNGFCGSTHGAVVQGRFYFLLAKASANTKTSFERMANLAKLIDL